MRPLIFLCVVTGAGLVYLMSQASSNTTLFTQNYRMLLWHCSLSLAVANTLLQKEPPNPTRSLATSGQTRLNVSR